MGNCVNTKPQQQQQAQQTPQVKQYIIFTLNLSESIYIPDEMLTEREEQNKNNENKQGKKKYYFEEDEDDVDIGEEPEHNIACGMKKSHANMAQLQSKEINCEIQQLQKLNNSSIFSHNNEIAQQLQILTFLNQNDGKHYHRSSIPKFLTMENFCFVQENEKISTETSLSELS